MSTEAIAVVAYIFGVAVGVMLMAGQCGGYRCCGTSKSSKEFYWL